MRLTELVAHIRDRRRITDCFIVLIVPTLRALTPRDTAMLKLHKVYVVEAEDRHVYYRLSGVHIAELYMYDVSEESQAYRFLRTRLRTTEGRTLQVHMYFSPSMAQ